LSTKTFAKHFSFAATSNSRNGTSVINNNSMGPKSSDRYYEYILLVLSTNILSMKMQHTVRY